MLAVRGPTPKPTMPVAPGTDDGAIGSDDAPIATAGDSAPSDDAGGAIATVGATHECSETADCDFGYVCSSGSCTDDKGNTVEHYCTQTSDCDQGYECQASTSLCKSKNVTAVNKYCETSVDCFPGYQCLEGTCVTAVRGPTPSPTPPHSAAGSPAASAAADASDSSSSDGASHYCDETADCDSGYTCDTTTSRCTETKTNSTGLMTYCETSVDCQPGYQCMEGQCVDAVRGPTPTPTPQHSVPATSAAPVSSTESTEASSTDGATHRHTVPGHVRTLGHESVTGPRKTPSPHHVIAPTSRHSLPRPRAAPSERRAPRSLSIEGSEARRGAPSTKE